MTLPGRNEPCHCGSGKKYKRCCLDKDKLHSSTPNTTIDSIRYAIDTNMQWENELYRYSAHHLLNHINPDYGAENIEATVLFWKDYTSAAMPIFKKFGAFNAALDYMTARVSGHPATQTEIARKYGVSGTTVSKRYNELMDFAGAALDGFPETGASGLPPMEQLMREIKYQLKDQSFENEKEAEAFVKAYLQDRMDGKEPSGLPAPTKRDEAENLLYQAMNEASSAKRLRLVKEAMKLYPDHPFAYLILSEEARTSEEALHHLKDGIAAGERDLGEAFFKENEGMFWGLTETRPYMQAKYNYAEFCWMHGDSAEARKQFEHILALNPMDNLGARYVLLAVYLYEDRLDQAERLLEEYDEPTASFMYDRIVLEFKKRGITAALKMHYRSAVHANPHIPEFLLGDRELPKAVPEYYGSGDVNEAVVYVFSHARLWMELSELAAWLDKQQ